MNDLLSRIGRGESNQRKGENMSFAKQLARLRETAYNRQPGVKQDKVCVDRRDLQELINDFDRIDSELRSLLPKNGSEGILLVAKERKRKIEEEGWTPEHDDQHANDELALAAACYVLPEDYRGMWFIAKFWPWDQKWWKPTPEDRKRELVKASALIAAEIDRIDRLQLKGAE